LVGFDDVLDQIVRILDVDSQHLDGFSPILDGLHDLVIDCLSHIDYPCVVLPFVRNSRLDKFDNHQEVLVNVVQKILQVDVHTCLGVDGCLLTGQ
jgi:hypothetical protein